MQSVEQTVLGIGTGLFVVGSLADMTFFALFSARRQAFRSAIGLMFVLMSASTLAVAVAVVLGRLFGADYPGRSLLTLGVYGIWAVAMVWKLGVYLWERRQPPEVQHVRVVRLFRSRKRRAVRRVTGNTGPVPIFRGGTE